MSHVFSCILCRLQNAQPNWQAKTARGDHGAEVVEVTDIIQEREPDGPPPVGGAYSLGPIFSPRSNSPPEESTLPGIEYGHFAGNGSARNSSQASNAIFMTLLWFPSHFWLEDGQQSEFRQFSFQSNSISFASRFLLLSFRLQPRVIYSRGLLIVGIALGCRIDCFWKVSSLALDHSEFVIHHGQSCSDR